eukprot:1391398-Pleurochrysis_carterae.AAC.1
MKGPSRTQVTAATPTEHAADGWRARHSTLRRGGPALLTRLYPPAPTTRSVARRGRRAFGHARTHSRGAREHGPPPPPNSKRT